VIKGKLTPKEFLQQYRRLLSPKWKKAMNSSMTVEVLEPEP